MKSYDAKINTDFHNSGMPKDGFGCICFSIILIGSVSKINKSYYPQVLFRRKQMPCQRKKDNPTF